jgi:glucosamine 6-phosphate synthetase-like amidotransferase/phosphosugar isomerase protein
MFNEFIEYINKHDYVVSERYKLLNYFESIDNITMDNIKLYYLEVLKNINPDKPRNLAKSVTVR